MKKYLKNIFNRFFKKKKYLSERQEIGFTRSSLIEVAKKVIEEEDKTKEIDSKLKNKLKVLEMNE